MASSVVHWTEAKTQALLSIWGSEQIQSKLDGVVRNKNIYERISNQLSKSGVSRNWKQCRDSVKNLLAKYRKIKDNNRQIRNNGQNCVFYSEIDAIVGTRPISVPPVVVESQTAADTAESTATTAVTISTERSTESEISEEVMNNLVSSNEQREQQEKEDLQKDDDISKVTLVSIVK